MPKAKYIRRPSKEELYRLYVEDEKSMTTIANMFDTSSSMVCYWMKSAHIDSRPRGKYNRKPDRDELHRLYVDEFVSIPKLSEMFGCSISTVHRWLIAENIDRRTQSESRLGDKHRLSEDELFDLYITKQMSTPDISKEYSVSSSTIARWLIASEIPIRSPSEAHLIGKHRPDNESLYRMYVEEGMTTTSIADVCGVCAHTVWLWLVTCGISPRSGSDAHMVGKHKPTADELNWMYTIDNLSTHEIGRMVGVDSGTIGRWLKEYGIYVRSVSESLNG